MPKSHYTLERPRALRQFTDREEFIAAFDRCLAEYDGDPGQARQTRLAPGVWPLLRSCFKSFF